MITLPPKIERDIQSNQTFLIPLIVVSPESDNPIYISTNKGLFDGQYYEDRNLQVSSIKESVNLESSKFKINNVSLSISNFTVLNNKFSDFVYEKGLLNDSIDIYYKSQSCQTLEDCILIYRGVIKRFTHDDKSCKIQLEDKTEDKLNQEIPKANTGYRRDLYSKEYLNKPIPILYGRVDKAPAIPFIDQTTIGTNSKIKIACDDTLGANPRITLGDYFNDDSTQPFLNGDINPLFIYKDDYFQVLQNYNFEVITSDTANWEWTEYDQYTLQDGYLEVLKKYQNLTPVNPPSNNELQTVKLRFPNNFISLANPTDGESAYEDAQDFGVSYEEPIIKSPEFAYDNPYFSESVGSQYIVNPIDYKASFAQVPDTTEALDDTIDFILQDFNPTRSGHGIMNDVDPAGENIRSQYEVMSFLTRNAHVDNDINNPRIQFLRLPSGNVLEERLNRALFNLYANREGIDIAPYENGTLQRPQMFDKLSVRINSAASFTKDFLLNYAEAQGFTNLDWFSNNFIVQDSEVIFDYQEGFQTQVVENVADGSMWRDLDINSESSFHYLHTDGSAQGRTGTIDYPNLFVRFEISDTYKSSLETSFVTISLANGNLATYNDQEYIGLYFDLIDIGNGVPSLFQEDELGIYTPINQTFKQRVGTNDRNQITKYDCYWNGTPYNNTDIGNPPNFGTAEPYFGHYTARDFNSTTYKVSESYIFPSASLGANSGWVLWIRDDITQLGSNANPQTFANEKNYSADNLKVAANTLIPMINLSKTYASHGSYWTGFDFDTGNMLNLDAEKITINNPTDTSSRRYGAVFPFKDQDISDDIRTDTYFSGKIKLIFDTEDTTNSTDSFLKVNLGAMDVEAETFDTDWGAFDANLDNESATLINQSLSDCILNTNTYYDTFDQSADETNQNAYTFNYYEDLLSITDEFHNPNNYNALGMFFRLDGNVNPANIARFNLEVNSISMLHYIIFEAALDSPMYVNLEGRVNLSNDIDANGRFKYTGDEIDNTDDVSLIEKPCDVIYHLAEKELELNDSIDIPSLVKARNESIIEEIAFSANENIKAKTLIEKICQSTNMFSSFKSTSDLSFISIKSEYDSADTIIRSKDIISYSFTRTPIEKIHTIVNVKYKKDYAEGEMKEQTGYCDGYDFFGNADLGYNNGYSYEYLGLDREDKVLEFESDIIRNKQSAIALRDFIYKYNCNQHNIIKFKLPLRYLNLEVGDVIEFDSLIGDVKIYGEDYTQPIIRNGQLIYPYFIIDSIDKKRNEVNIQATQLHRLTATFSAQIGSITRTVSQNDLPGFTIEDFNELEEFLLEEKQYYTTEQKRASDLNRDGYIDEHDLLALEDLLNVNEFNFDVNADGNVNVVDIIAIMNQVLSSEEQSDEILNQFDVNEDGTVNIVDVLLITQEALGN